MKKLLTNFKYSFFTLVVLFTGLVVAQTAHADTYSYACSDGGNIPSVVTIGPPNGPYQEGNPTTFEVSAFMGISTCTTKTVNLVAQNNGGTSYTLIPTQTLNQGGFLGPFYDSVNFASPSPAGNYSVTFKTGVDDEEIIVPPGSCQAYVRFVGTFRFGGVIWIGPAQHPQVTVTVALVGNASGALPGGLQTTNNPPQYADFIIPANASQSVMGEFYGVHGFDHGWVDHTSLSWACGDATQNYQPGTQVCDGTITAGNNKPCVDGGGYRIMDPNAEGTIPTACRYLTNPQNRPFCPGHAPFTQSNYCPTPAGACN